MAPIHHHFELLGLVGDQDHRALLDHGRDRERDRLHALPAEHRGLRAAADAATAAAGRPVSGRGARALGRGGGAGAAPRRDPGARDRGLRLAARPPEAAEAAERLARGGRRSPSRHRWNAASRRIAAACERWSRAPACPPGAPARRARARARARRPRRARDRLAAGAERVLRRDGHERQDDDDRADRRDPPRRRACRSRSPATSARPVSALAGDARPRGAPSSARHRASSSRTRSAFAPEAGGVPQLLRGPPRPPRDVDELPRGEAAPVRATRRRADVAVLNAGEPALPSASSAGAASVSGSATSPTASCACGRTPAVAGRAADRRVGGAAARPAQPRQRDGRRRGHACARHRPDAVRAALRDVRRRPAPARARSPRSAASLYVNDSKATNVGRRGRRAATRSRAACTRSSAARSRAATSSALAPAVAERCRACYLIGEAAGPARRGPRRRAASSWSRCGDLERAVAEAARRARSRARSCCSRRPARASTSTATSRQRGEHFRAARARAAREGTRWSCSALSARSASARAMTFEQLDAAHGDALPDRVRGGDGLQRELRHVAAVRGRRQLLLPEALPRSRRRSGCSRWPSARATALEAARQR